MDWYFTFGQEHTDPQTGEPLRDYWVRVTAPTYEAARRAMLERYGTKWAFQYQEAGIRKDLFPKGERKHLTASEATSSLQQ